MDQPGADMATVESPVGTLYTVEEVARFLRVTQRAVQVWIRGGALPAVRYGRLLRIRQADLAAFGEVVNQRTTALSTDECARPAPAGAAQE